MGKDIKYEVFLERKYPMIYGIKGIEKSELTGKIFLFLKFEYITLSHLARILYPDSKQVQLQSIQRNLGKINALNNKTTLLGCGYVDIIQSDKGNNKPILASNLNSFNDYIDSKYVIDFMTNQDIWFLRDPDCYDENGKFKVLELTKKVIRKVHNESRKDVLFIKKIQEQLSFYLFFNHLKKVNPMNFLCLYYQNLISESNSYCSQNDKEVVLSILHDVELKSYNEYSLINSIFSPSK